MRRLTIVTFWSVGLLAACASSSQDVTQAAATMQSTPLEQPFTLKPGDSATVGEDRVQVRFDEVVSDSRCPKDVQCIQAGEAVVRVTVTVSGSGESLELNTNPNGARGQVGAYALMLTELAPVPISTQRIRPSDYRATFALARAR